MTMTFLQRYRAVLFVSALITAVAALFIIGSDGVRAPLLTMLGGVMLLAALFPNDISQW